MRGTIPKGCSGVRRLRGFLVAGGNEAGVLLCGKETASGTQPATTEVTGFKERYAVEERETKSRAPTLRVVIRAC